MRCRRFRDLAGAPFVDVTSWARRGNSGTSSTSVSLDPGRRSAAAMAYPERAGGLVGRWLMCEPRPGATDTDANFSWCATGALSAAESGVSTLPREWARRPLSEKLGKMRRTGRESRERPSVRATRMREPKRGAEPRVERPEHDPHETRCLGCPECRVFHFCGNDSGIGKCRAQEWCSGRGGSCATSSSASSVRRGV